MKKLLLTIGVVAAGVSAFAQGYGIFGSSGSYVWNTNSTRAAAGTVDTAFLFATSSSAVPLLAGIMASTPTNSASVHLTSTQATTAWSDILTDPNFQLAHNNTAGANVVGTTTAAGGISYNGGNPFVINNTASGGGTIYVVAISWDATYSSAAAAAAANASVGWSSVFAYNYVAGPVPGPQGTPTSMGAQQTGWQFGTLSVVPEPSTMALAALGGASLLLFRRRK